MKDNQVLRVALIPLLFGLGFFAACGSDDGDDGGGDGDGGAGSTATTATTSSDSGIDLTAGSTESGDGDSSTSATSSSGDGDACGGTAVEATPVETQMLLVVDTSESMDDTPGGFAKTKWETLVDSLNVALPKVEQTIGMGLKMFPSGDTEGSQKCNVETGIEVDIALSTDNVSDVLAELEAESRDGASQGDTPTAAALGDALDYFTDGVGKDLEGNRIVLLATDGGPNCNDSPKVDCTCDGDPSASADCGVRDRCTLNIDQTSTDGVCSLDGSFGSCCLADQPDLCLDDAGTIDAVKALSAAGIKTIVVGIPGSEAYTDVLDALAEAGGIPSDGDTKYYKVDDPDGLTQTLEKITLNLIKSCEIDVAEPPSDVNEVNVYLDGEVVYKDDEDGWIYPGEAEKDYSKIELVGPTCERVQQEGVGKIAVKYGCETIIR